MADFEAKARTNYFTVKDAEAFKAAIAPLDVTFEVVPEGEENAGQFALFADGDHGTWPDGYYVEEEDDQVCQGCGERFGDITSTTCQQDQAHAFDDHVDVDIVDLVGQYLVEPSVAIFITAGAEKMRYVGAYASVVNAHGEREDVDFVTYVMQLVEARELGTATHPSY